ncbi:hypothetical protein [Gynurincola endophyticus]|jgi:uncharacterized membrane protein|uniref:hypothetical protein n=1 Tax=Gynurincola endophyticus TaxID=2479004 RepID=UPI000F8C38F8|nr:hypothetical protein [Gynurincola endophyticus]
MKAANVQVLKQALKDKKQSELVELCLRLARFKAENKELLSYLLFDESDLSGYLQHVKEEMEIGFETLNTQQTFLAKKTIRKVLRIANKHIRYIGQKEAQAEILIYFLHLLKHSGYDVHRSAVMMNLYKTQLKKIDQVLETLHEDLQFEYKKSREEVSLDR